MKKTFLILLLLFFSGYSRAEMTGEELPSGKITGLTLDAKGNTLIYTNVVLLNAKDSTMVKGAIADDKGNFTFNEVTQGEYILCATQIGYKKTYSKSFVIKPTQQHREVFNLSEDSQVLKEVTVTAQKPFIEQQLDKMVVNINNSITNAGNNALEVLEKIPGVTVDNDNRLNIQGKSGVLIMIDGRPSQLSKNDLGNYLRGFNSADIEKIEVITNPSSKYDAAGNAGIINIILKKNVNHGINGTAGSFFRQGIYSRYGTNANMNLKQKKYGIYAGHVYSNRNAYSQYDIVRRINQQGSILSLNQNYETESPYRSNSGRVIFDYYPTSKTTLSLTGFFISTVGNVIGQNTTTSQTSLKEAFVSKNITASNIGEKINNYSVNAYFKKTFTKPEQELTAQYDRNIFNQTASQLFNSDFFDANNIIIKKDFVLATLPADVLINSAKVDFISPIGKKGNLETGLKWSNVSTDNLMQFYKDPQKTQIDNDRLNDFEYKETVNAAYISFKQVFAQKWTLQTGLRLEQTLGNGHQAMPRDSVFKRSYLNLFPTLYLQRTLSEKATVKLTYNRRIDRPSYQDLNPFRYFVDAFTYKEGNPFLRPQFTNKVELSHVYRSALTNTLSYSVTNDIITPTIRQNDAQLITYQSTENLATQKVFAFTSILPIPLKKFGVSINYINISHKAFESSFLNNIFTLKRTTFTFNSMNNITLPKNWGAELTGFYQSRSFFGILNLEPIWAVSAGVQKSFLDKKATIKLNIADVFWSRISRLNLKYENLDTEVTNRTDSRNVTLSFNYSFGRKTITNLNNRRSGVEDEKKRVKLGEEK